MKKILQISAQKPDETGSGIFFKSLAKEMTKKGYEQAALVGINSKDKNYFENDNVEYYPVYFESKTLPFPVVGMSDVMPYKSTKYSDMDEEMLELWINEFKKVLNTAVSEFKPDIIISHHLWLLTAYVKEWFPSIPVLAISHGSDLRQLEKSKRFSEKVILSCKNIEKVFALNNLQKEKIIEKYGINDENIIVMGSAYNGDIFYPSNKVSNNNSINLVYVGKLSYSKGVMSLLDAFDKIDFCGIDVKLTIVGSGRSIEAEIIKETADKIDKKIEFTGMVTQERLGKILRESHIFILPSFYEGLPLVLIEALASGLRVVTTDLPGVKEWIGENVNNTGVISYIALPRLKNTDEPEVSDIPKFNKELQETIENQISKLSNSQGNFEIETVRKRTEKMCWESLFLRMEDYINNL